MQCWRAAGAPASSSTGAGHSAPATCTAASCQLMSVVACQRRPPCSCLHSSKLPADVCSGLLAQAGLLLSLAQRAGSSGLGWVASRAQCRAACFCYVHSKLSASVWCGLPSQPSGSHLAPAALTAASNKLMSGRACQQGAVQTILHSRKLPAHVWGVLPARLGAGHHVRASSAQRA